MQVLTLKIPSGTKNSKYGWTAMELDLPSERGYKVKMRCFLGLEGHEGMNVDASKFLVWCDYRWKVKNHHFVVYGDAEIVAERATSAREEDLDEYVRAYLKTAEGN